MKITATYPTEVTADIDGTGTDDVSADLSAFLQDLPDGADVDLGGGTYRCDRAVKVTGKTGLTIRNGSFDVAAPSTELDRQGRSIRRHLWFTHCTDLTLQHLTVTGANTTFDNGTPVDVDGQATYDAKREWEHGVAVEDCARVTVTDFRADAVFGDGVYWRRVTDGALERFEVSRNGRQGVAMISTAGLKVLHGVIRHSRRSGIDLEPNVPAEVIEGVEIGHMRIRSRLIPVTAGGPGTVRGVHIHDIDVTSPSVPTLSAVPKGGGRRDHWLVERWTTHNELGSPMAAVRLGDADDVTLRDFTAPCKPRRGMTGVELIRTGAVVLDRCTFEGAAQLTSVVDPATDHSVTATGCVP